MEPEAGHKPVESSQSYYIFFSMRFNLKFSFHLNLGPQMVSSLQISPSHFPMHFSFPQCMLHVPAILLSILNHSNYSRRILQIINFLRMQFSPSCFLLFKYKSYLRSLFSHTLNLRSSLKVCETTFHIHIKLTGTILFACFNRRVSERRRSYTRFWTEWHETGLQKYDFSH
jgi:hypothetical protein